MMVTQLLLAVLTAAILATLTNGNSESAHQTEKQHFDYDDQLAIESSNHASYLPAISPDLNWSTSTNHNPAPLPSGDRTVSFIAELAMSKQLPELTSSSPMIPDGGLPTQELSSTTPESDSRAFETASKAVLQESAPTPLSALPEVVSTSPSVQQEQSSTTIFPKSYLLPDDYSTSTKIPQQVVHQFSSSAVPSETTKTPPTKIREPLISSPYSTLSRQKVVPKISQTSTGKNKGQAHHRKPISTANLLNRFDRQNFSSITDKIDSFLAGDDQPVTANYAGNLPPPKNRLVFVNSSVVDFNDSSDPAKPCSITIINYIYPKDGAANADPDQEISIVDHVDKNQGSEPPAVRDYLASTKFGSSVGDKAKHFPNKKDTTKPKMLSDVARNPPIVKKDMSRPVSRVDTSEREKLYSKPHSDVTTVESNSQSTTAANEVSTPVNIIPPREIGPTTVRPQSQVPQPTASGSSINSIRMPAPPKENVRNNVDPRFVSPSQNQQQQQPRLPVPGPRPVIAGYQDPRQPKEEYYTLSATQLSRLFSTYMRLNMEQDNGGPPRNPDDDDSFGSMGVASGTSNRQAPPPITLYNGPPSEFEQQMAAGIRDGFRGVMHQNRPPPPPPMVTQRPNFPNAPPINHGVPPRGPFMTPPPVRGPTSLKDFILNVAASQLFGQQMRPNGNQFHFNNNQQRPPPPQPPPQFFFNGQQRSNLQNRPREVHYVIRHNDDQDD